MFKKGNTRNDVWLPAFKHTRIKNFEEKPM